LGGVWGKDTEGKTDVGPKTLRQEKRRTEGSASDDCRGGVSRRKYMPWGQELLERTGAREKKGGEKPGLEGNGLFGVERRNKKGHFDKNKKFPPGCHTTGTSV